MSKAADATSRAAEGASALGGFSINTVLLAALALGIVLVLAYFLGKTRQRPDHPPHDLPSPDPPDTKEPSTAIKELVSEHEAQWREDGIMDGRSTAEIEQALKEKLNRRDEE